MSKVELHCMDALEFLATLPDRSIDFIFTDPPYGHNNNNNGDLIHRREAALGKGKHGESRAIANDGIEANELFQNCLPEYYRLLVPGGVVCCCCGGGGPDPQFARWALWLDDAFNFKQMVVWDKGAIGMGWHYRRSYETILVAEKPGAKPNWYDTTHRVENIIRPGYKGIKKKIPSRDDHPTEKPVELVSHFLQLHTQPDDIVLDPFMGSGTTGISCILFGRNPCEKPLTMLEHIIKSSSKEGATVLDAFMGGGNSGIAARNLGRNYIGVDIEQKWFDVSKARIDTCQMELIK